MLSSGRSGVSGSPVLQVFRLLSNRGTEKSVPTFSETQANLVALGANPLTLDSDAIKGIPIQETFASDRSVYKLTAGGKVATD